MNEEKLKEAFSKIKEDIFNLSKEITEIKDQFQETNNLIRKLDEGLIQLKLDKNIQNYEDSNKNLSTDRQTDTSTHNPPIQTHPVTSTHNSTDGQEIGGWKTQNLSISIGNGGVSTDRQTDRQTDQQTPFSPEIPHLVTTKPIEDNQENENVVTNKIWEAPQENLIKTDEKPIKQQISEATEILDSLDNIKKEIRKKFKSITKQEMLVFSTIYTLDEQDPETDYKKIASKTNLSESSIRDYVQRMINKGVPIDKEKLNNKKILLHISPELKKIATLNTIIKLRDL